MLKIWKMTYNLDTLDSLPKSNIQWRGRMFSIQNQTRRKVLLRQPWTKTPQLYSNFKRDVRRFNFFSLESIFSFSFFFFLYSLFFILFSFFFFFFFFFFLFFFFLFSLFLVPISRHTRKKKVKARSFLSWKVKIKLQTFFQMWNSKNKLKPRPGRVTRRADTFF